MNLDNQLIKNVDLVNKNKYIPKTKEEKEKIRKKIINYVKEEVNKNRFPGKREIQRKFNLSFYSYFNSTAIIYNLLGVDLLKNPNFRHNCEIKKRIKEEMIKYIKSSLEKGHRVTVEDIRREFRSGIEAYFPRGIIQLYKEAGIDLNNTFSFLYKEKERKLTPIVKKFLEDKGYVINRVAIEENRFGPDLIVSKEGQFIPVEIKARHKNNTLLYPRDNPIKQITNYIKGLNSKFGILVTTTEKIFSYKLGLPNNVLLFTGRDLLEHFKYDEDFFEDLVWIRRTVGQDKKDFIKEKRIQIINFIKEEFRKGNLPKFKEIRTGLKIDFYCYFKSVEEAYKRSGIEYPQDRNKKFGRMTEKMRKDIREKIIDYVRKQYLNGGKLNINEVEKKFHISIRTYFKNRKEIYKLANIKFTEKEYIRRFGLNKKGPNSK